MVGSTVYGFFDHDAAKCDIIESYGYSAINSSRGTLRLDPTLSNLENCFRAVKDCDVFFLTLQGVSSKSCVFQIVPVNHLIYQLFQYLISTNNNNP